MLSNEKRVSYQGIKSQILEAYFEGCRDLALPEGRPHAEIMGYVVYQFENSFEQSIENLMMRVVQLVISGGWHADAARYTRNQIVTQLEACGIDNLLADIPRNEADMFRHDLKILKLI